MDKNYVIDKLKSLNLSSDNIENIYDIINNASGNDDIIKDKLYDNMINNINLYPIGIPTFTLDGLYIGGVKFLNGRKGIAVNERHYEVPSKYELKRLYAIIRNNSFIYYHGKLYQCPFDYNFDRPTTVEAEYYPLLGGDFYIIMRVENNYIRVDSYRYSNVQQFFGKNVTIRIYINYTNKYIKFSNAHYDSTHGRDMIIDVPELIEDKSVNYTMTEGEMDTVATFCSFYNPMFNLIINSSNGLNISLNTTNCTLDRVGTTTRSFYINFIDGSKIYQVAHNGFNIYNLTKV